MSASLQEVFVIGSFVFALLVVVGLLIAAARRDMPRNEAELIAAGTLPPTELRHARLLATATTSKNPSRYLNNIPDDAMTSTRSQLSSLLHGHPQHIHALAEHPHLTTPERSALQQLASMDASEREQLLA